MNKPKAKKVILLILDGWGIGKPDKFNAVDNAKTPNVDKLIRDFPNVQLRSDGPFVGLPEGQFGTSEINHQVIGSGRIFLQDLPRINNAIEDGSFFANEELLNAIAHTKENNSALHLVGIISDGKVHSSMSHLLALIEMAKKEGVKKIHIQAFVDGRDTAPKSAERYLSEVEEALKGFEEASIATVQGRFYLDRDRDWDKTAMAIDLITKGKGNKMKDWKSVINFNYEQNVTDEFFKQYLVDENGLIKENDAVIFTHYRTDRLHQILQSLINENIKNLKIITFIEVSEEMKSGIAFPREVITHTLAQTISEADKKQLHITETEKFTHLTFFLNGGREKEYPREEWMLLQSNRFAKPFYNFDPAMQAFKIAEEIIKRIENDSEDFIIANFSNTDMVGHTGNYEAAVIAAESVDFCVGRIFEVLKDKLDKYALIVTADHGNSDVMWDYENDQPHTQHTTNPVPFIVATNSEFKLDKRESLQDIAPTVFDLMGIEKPEIMTGKSLIIK
jgi:2,3-bisphosphoglycerate-independent phosphoglycerate mutase